jgi:protein-tyrosine phosphatase
MYPFHLAKQVPVITSRKLTNVFVHCYAGVSRSSAIVASYLMWKYRWPVDKTLAFLTNKRIVAKPNDGFYNQLKEVENKLGIVS